MSKLLFFVVSFFFECFIEILYLDDVFLCEMYLRDTIYPILFLFLVY